MKALSVVILIFILFGCGGVARQSYSVQESRAMPEWKRLAQRLLAYQRLACVTCTPTAWKLGVIKSEKLNAFNMGGGKFYVTEGLLRIPFEEQDAALAHEVAHEVSGHVQKRHTMSDAIAIVFSVAGIILPGIGLIDHAVNPLAVAAYSKEQELEADSIAVNLLQISHNDRAAGKRLYVLLKRLRSQEGASVGRIFENHPHPDDRIAKIEMILRGEKQSNLPTSYFPDRDTINGNKSGETENSDTNESPREIPQ